MFEVKGLQDLVPPRLIYCGGPTILVKRLLVQNGYHVYLVQRGKGTQKHR